MKKTRKYSTLINVTFVYISFHWIALHYLGIDKAYL